MKNSFSERCYHILRKVPRGKITTYREIAHSLGTRGYRAVGNAMNKNPYAPKVPCHRVVCTNGSLGGYAQGTTAKIKRLQGEGICIKDGRVQNFSRVLVRANKLRTFSAKDA